MIPNEPTMWTPLMPVREAPQSATVWCKLEFLNPSGSTKDRIASFILKKAFREGRIRAGSVVVEASSGSTSIAMARVCAQLGIRFIAVMPNGVSNERSMMIRAFGGEVHLGPNDADMGACMQIAVELAAQHGGFCPRQFENPDNANAHRSGTAREIAGQIPGHRIDAVVAGVGTGGTLVGIYNGLRDAGFRPRPFAAKPVAVVRAARHSCCDSAECFCDVESSSFSKRVPGVVDNMSKLFDPEEWTELEMIDVEDTHALEVTRRLHGLGFPVGPSAGLNVAAATKVADQLAPDAVVVTVLPDRMERYFSTQLFQAMEPEQSTAPQALRDPHGRADS